MTFDVSMTASRPSWLPLLLIGRNNLAPRLVLEEDALSIRVVRTTRLPLDQLRRVQQRDGLGAPYLVLTVGRWDYVVHFSRIEERQRLIEALRERIGSTGSCTFDVPDDPPGGG